MIGTDYIVGYVLGSDEARHNNEAAKNELRESIIEELQENGTLLPRYDWADKRFNETTKAITADWFARHPEIKRGTGEFQAKYPEKFKGIVLLDKMTGMGRITPEEYIILFREIHNF